MHLPGSDPDHYSPQLLTGMIQPRQMSCFQDINHCTFASCSNLCIAKGVRSNRAFCLNWTDKYGQSHVECCCPQLAASPTPTKMLIPQHPFMCYQDHDSQGCTTCSSFCGAKGFVAERAPCFTRNDDSGRAHSECCCTHETV